MDSRSTSASAAARAPEAGLLATASKALRLDQIRVTVSQKTGPSPFQTAKRDLYATFQLLANRIQYLTGASSATIALREGPELLCEASAGPMATELGASLRADPAFINHSIIAEQIFCCNNTRDAVSGDGNSYKDLGIKAIMVMPLFQGSKVVGVLELLADRRNAFNDAHGELLEHFAEMVFTALAQAEAAKPARIETEETVEIPVKTSGPEETAPVLSAEVATSATVNAVVETAPDQKLEIAAENTLGQTETPIASVEPSSSIAAREPASEPLSAVVGGASEKIESPAENIPEQKETAIAPVASACPTASSEPGPAAASAKVQFCEACGFPVSEGRKLCLDCEEGRSAAEPGETLGFLSQLEREQKQGWLDTHFYTVGTILMALLTVLALVLKFR